MDIPPEKYNIESGEDKAWRELLDADPREVERRSLAAYFGDAGTYTLDILGEKYEIDPSAKEVRNISNPSRKLEYFIKLSTPVYMAQAVEVQPSGELVKELRGGGFFFRGSHILPLEAVAEKYGRDMGLFLEAGRSMGGAEACMGDAAFRFYFYPRVSMTFVLWLEDDEFPARASLLFDSNADKHMALDVVWAVALVACQRMLGYRRG